MTTNTREELANTLSRMTFQEFHAFDNALTAAKEQSHDD